VLIRFEAISRKGNSLYLDNINLAGIPSADVSGVSSGRFDVFPNPTSGVLNYRLPSVTDEGRIEVHNVLGQAVLHVNGNRLTAEGTLDLGLLPPGVYQLKLYDGDVLKSSATVTVQ
jgi:hypothetical protein